MNSLDAHRGGQRGQALVLFTLVLVVIIAMTGLVLDGGGTFAQRRTMQNVADVAAMAGAYAVLNGGSATAVAQQTAADNGYVNGADNTIVSVSLGAGDSGDTTVTVNVSRPHQNLFAGVVGMPSWPVSTTATADAGPPNAAIGAMPLIFNAAAFPQNLNQDLAYNEPGTGTQDVPQGPLQFNWTVFCTAKGNPCNANSSTVDALINGHGSSTVVTLNMAIGPLNAGAHTTLFSDLAALVGTSHATFPVAIVNNSGNMVGWAYFQLTGSAGGSTKQIRGKFVSPINASDLSVVQDGGSGTTQFGAYTVKLIN